MSVSLPPPPSPSHILRIHAASVTHVSFSADNSRLYSGDVLGNVNVTTTRSLRPIASWKAHSDGILGIQEWTNTIITHGRDNKIHAWDVVFAEPIVTVTAARVSEATKPKLLYSLDVNALNFCRFSLLPLEPTRASSSTYSNESALVAVPNLIESSLADVWELPSCTRLHAAIGRLESPEQDPGVWQAESDGRGNAKTGILMSLHLLMKDRLYLLAAYESGDVCLRVRTAAITEKTVEGRGWQSLWQVRHHAESVMSMAVSLDCSFALTTSADPIVVRYDLFSNAEDRLKKFKIKQPGNASVAIKADGRVCSIGGWDGRARLFSTNSFKPLGSLAFHAKSCRTLAFANTPVRSDLGSEEDMEDMEKDEMVQKFRWLAIGSEDNRISLWELIDFGKKR